MGRELSIELLSSSTKSAAEALRLFLLKCSTILPNKTFTLFLKVIKIIIVMQTKAATQIIIAFVWDVGLGGIGCIGVQHWD
jgi:hypothetical protein